MKTRLFVSLVLLAATLVLLGCPQPTTSNRLNGDPARYCNKDVLIVGTVTTSFGVAGFGAYELSDKSGKIWGCAKQGRSSWGSGGHQMRPGSHS